MTRRRHAFHGGRFPAAVLLGAAWWLAPATVRAETEYGGIDFSGFSAYGSSWGYGAGGMAGIPLGPAPSARRPVEAPREVPRPPAGAIPAAAPPADPVLQAPMLGARQIVPPEVMEPWMGPPAAVVAQVPRTAESLPAPAASVPSAPPADTRLILPPSAPAPSAYGSESLGYGPATSFAPPPGFDPGMPPPAAPGPVTYAPPPPAPVAVEPVDRWPRLPVGPDNRFYLSGIMGADFATLEVGQGPNANGPLFTAGGAAGMAFERPNGWLRTEFEARYRDPVALLRVDPALGTASVSASDGWSTMVNGWRDFEISDRVGAYLGGGVGGAGYRVAFNGDFPAIGATLSGSTRLVSFAWQAGTGVTWLVHDRIAFDLGYRFLAIDGGNAQIIVSAPPISFTDAIDTRYGASELLFTVRVYEPFRRWGD